jgi:hypothetical protein
VLTGVEKTTSGDAVIYGKSVKHSLPDVLKMIGVCPQVSVSCIQIHAYFGTA